MSSAAPSASAQTRPSSTCPARPSVAPPGFQPNGRSAVERFDLSYATTRTGLIEVRFASRNNGGALVFVGTEHITPPDPDLFAHLEALFAREKPTESYIEVADVAYLDSLPTVKEQVIRTRGEPSYLGFIARQQNVPVRPLEPQPGELFAQVRRKFPAEEIALAHVLRDVQIARDRRRAFGEALEKAAARSISEQRELVRAAGAKFPIANILDLTLAVSRQWPGLDWRQVPAEWSNPLLEPSETGSKFVNAIFAEEKALRDGHALSLLLSRVAAGERVVALAGRSHAQSHLQTLSCLMSQY